MKTAATKYFQKTVSGTKKYAVAASFVKKMAALKQELQPNAQRESQLPSRLALRKHPCHLSLPPLTLPDHLDRAAIDYLREHCLFSIKHLNQLSAKLNNFLHERPILTEMEILEKRRVSQAINNPPVETPDDAENFEDTNQSKIDDVLKYYSEKSISGAGRSLRQNRNLILSGWKPLTFNKENSQLYLVGRLAPNFATACRVLYEIRKRCPLFVPRSLFDFASGLGTYTWAANTVWPAGCIREHYLVEASTHMTSISEFLLLKRGKGIPPSETVFPGVRHRRFLPSLQINADLVMSGYVLLEVAGEVERMKIVENLWQRTSGFLVLIEEGTKAGFSALLEARDRLIKRGGEDMHMFAPCPHLLKCGKVGMTCSSAVRYYQLGLTKDEAYPSVENFSYLVVSRGDWRRFASPDEAEHVLPRIVSTLPNPRAPALDVDLCLPNGDCERVTFSRTGTDRTLFFFLKNSAAGDIAPCLRSTEDSVDEEAEDIDDEERVEDEADAVEEGGGGK
uniref:Methyltransferase-like protein 17 n=1 Tax=Schistocephalus solidus TaxID=70667 RepID=A0A0X3PNI3_SCHSO